MEKINYQSALKLLKEYLSSESLFKHSLAVACAMEGLAQKFDKDKEKWKVTGLLHDLDYEKYPKEHPKVALKILKEKGYPEDIISAIWGHFSPERERKTLLAKSLFAVDELSGLAVASALMRPTGFQGMTPKSLRKKLKDKGFARGIKRENILLGIKELGLPEDELFDIVIKSLAKIESQLLN